jgi:hypothetical protein
MSCEDPNLLDSIQNDSSQRTSSAKGVLEALQTTTVCAKKDELINKPQ